MGLIERILSTMFGGGRNMVAETVGVFRENAENGAMRAGTLREATLQQFGQEFRSESRGWFDRLMDGVNRLPRPAMAMGTLGLFVAAMVDPIWFAARMQGIALVPQPLWWLLGAIVSFYFGARHQAKGQEFQRELGQAVARVPQVVENLKSLDALDIESEPVGPIERSANPVAADTGNSVAVATDNPALEAWHRKAA